MTKWFQNRSILFKLLAAGLPILVGISLSSALIMYLFFKISDRATRIHSIADTVTIGMLSARVAEKNFILHDLQKDVFYKSGGSVYLEEHKAHAMSARDEILKLISLLSGPQQEYVRSLLKLVDAYSDIFTEMVQSYGQRGFKDWGYLGQWRRAIHDVENSILRMNRPDLQEDLLQMRRLEKDYLLRGEDQYIDAILDLWHNLRSRIARVSGPLIEETLANLQTYAKAFKNYVAIQDKIGRSDADGLQKEFLGVINKMKSVLENILTEANRENQMARRNFILISIVIYVFGTLLGGVCFYFFSRSISATLVTLKDAALNVGKGRAGHPSSPGLPR